MVETIKNEYHPDTVTCPGESLAEILEDCGMSQAELARRTGRPTKTINGIIKGREALTPDTALQLEIVLGVKARFWNSLERNYREHMARVRESERLESDVAWLKQLPIKVMKLRGWLPKTPDLVENVRAALTFFGVASVKEWERVYMSPQVSYRKSHKCKDNPAAVATWLRAGEIVAKGIECSPYSEVVFRDALSELRTLTQEDPKVFQPAMIKLCAQGGVAVAFVPEFKGAPISGATRWLNPRKALIQLSLRYKTNDQLWFSFFHESGHILNHGKRDVFIETNGDDGSREEKEADRFACDFLIPPNDYKNIAGHAQYSHDKVVDFAESIGVHPGLVVGRLQHDEYLPYSHLNKLKMSLKWS